MDKRIQPVRFPRDHQSHNAIVEWWYFNGQVRDKKGDRYGFMHCLFKVDARKVNVPFLTKLPLKKVVPSWPYVYFSHSIVSDISRQVNEKAIQNISIASRDSFTKDRLFVNYIDPLIFRGYVTNEIAETGPDQFHVKGDLLDLDFTSKKKPLLEGGKGYVTLGGKGTYYYSLTDLEARGSLMIKGERVDVEGKAWMDHQWADVPYSKDAWTWFSIQLNNGTDIMCVRYDGHVASMSGADIVDASGKAVHGRRVVFTPGKEEWVSPKTKAAYPLDWKVELPEDDIELAVRSSMKDQEMIYGTINYWEGPLDVEGTVKGKRVRGTGYMELVGYPSDYNYLVLAGKELNAKVREALLSKLHRPRPRFVLKPSYLIIPLITILVSLAGSMFTSSGIDSGWYASIAKPSWTPPGSVIGAVWTTIFILTTISAIIVWNKVRRDQRFRWIIGIFIANAALNVFWSFLFFGQAMIGAAVLEAAILDLTVIALIVLIWPVSRIASLLLAPYAAWVAFATYLTYTVWGMN